MIFPQTYFWDSESTQFSLIDKDLGHLFDFFAPINKSKGF